MYLSRYKKEHEFFKVTEQVGSSNQLKAMCVKKNIYVKEVC